MHEILKRALDEALTAAYAGEIPAGAEEVAFSEGFEREMRGLIRKTDRPIQKYIPILTAAACAVIAIGCAVLLPRLLSHSVPVKPGEESTATVTSSAPTDEPAESTSAMETNSDEPDEIRDENPGAAGIIVPPDDWDANPNYGPGPDEFGDENSGAVGEISDDEEDTTEWDDEDSVINGEDGVPAVTGSSALTVEPAPQDPNDFPATGGPDSEENMSDDAVEEETEVADKDDEGGDDTAEEDVDVDDDDADYIRIDEDVDADRDTIGDDDEDADYDDDDDDDDIAYDDSDDDMDIDDDETIDESSLPPIAKRATLNGEVQTLLGCSLADSYLHNGRVLGNELYDLPIMEGISPETYRDPELAELIGTAKYLEGEPEEIGIAIFYGNIGKEAPVIRPAYESDQSDRNRYGEIYFGEDSQIGDEEDEMDTPVETVYLEILQNGIVSVRKEGYRGAAYYRLDDAVLEKLTARIEARFKMNKPETVGELSEQIGSAEAYARVYVSIRRYYDCTMYGAVSDGSFFAELLEKYKGEKLSEPDGLYGDTLIQIDLTSRKTLQTTYFDFYADGTVIVSGRKAFTVDQAELRAILSEYCRQKDLPAPVFYETLGEYLKDKNFTALTEARLYEKDSHGDMLLSGDSAEVRDLIEKYAAKSAYLPGGRSSSQQERVEIRVGGWLPTVRINRDVIVIANGYSWNIFETPDGLYDKLCAVISEKGESPYAGRDEDYEDDDVSDDEEIDEDVED